MCLIHQLFELVGRTESGRNTEEVGAVVAKGAIVWMFDHSHDLYDIVSQVLDPRQHVLSELAKGVHSFLNARHTDVALVHLHILVLPRGLLVFPLVGTQIDVYSIEGVVFILSGEVYPSRDAISHAAILQLHLNL